MCLVRGQDSSEQRGREKLLQTAVEGWPGIKARREKVGPGNHESCRLALAKRVERQRVLLCLEK